MTTVSPHGRASLSAAETSRPDGTEDQWEPPHARWAWWVMVVAFSCGITIMIINWVGWANLPVAARFLVLAELFAVAVLVLFLLLGERLAEFTGYGSLWADDELVTSSSLSQRSWADSDWSRSSKIDMYLRRSFLEVRSRSSWSIPETRQAEPEREPPSRGVEPPRKSPSADSAVPAPRSHAVPVIRNREVIELPQPTVPQAAPSPQEPPSGGAPPGPRSKQRIEIRRRY